MDCPCQRPASASSNWNFEEVGSEFSGFESRERLPLQHYKRWTPKDTQPWRQFHANWWGPSGAKRLQECLALPNAERVVCIEQGVVYAKFYILTETGGKLLVRDEIVYTYERARCVSGEDGVRGAVVLTGQTGVGKSSALVYFLLARMAEECRTLLTTSGKRTYLVDSNGIWEMPASQFDFEEDLFLPDGPPTNAERIWSLIDSPWSREEHSGSCESMWLSESLGYVFPVKTVSPDEVRYREGPGRGKGARGRVGERVFVMDPWSVGDMVAALRLSNHRPANLPDEQCVRNVMRNIGPIPSDVFHHFADTEGRRIYRGSFTKFKTIDCLITNVLSYFSFCDSSAQCDQVFIMRRIEHKGKSDRILLDFRSKMVEENIVKQFGLLVLEEAERLFSVCPFPERSGLAGWVFEGVAVHLLAGRADLPQCGLAELKRMRLVKNMNPDPELAGEPDMVGPRFVEDDASIPRSQGDVLYVTPRGSSVLENVNVTPKIEHETSPSQASLSACEKFVARTTDFTGPGTPDDGQDLYFLNDRANPIFDAFTWNLTGQRAVLSVFKFVNPRFCGVASTAFNAIREMKAKADSWQHFKVRYILVVPRRDQNPVVVWKMSLGWTDDVQGEIYVQYIDPVPWRASTPA